MSDTSSLPDSPIPPPSLSLIPGFEILEPIGQGGMGCVYCGRDLSFQRDLAVKVLLEAHQGKPSFVRRFLREAHVLGQLEHPNIVPVHTQGVASDGRPYFTMRLVRGQTLSRLLR